MYKPGTVLAGKYRIERQLGRGGMGLVLAAEHIDLRTLVAVKCLHNTYAARDDVLRRFLREARASAQLRSEHVCRVFDVGRLDTGVPYIVMELLHGSDLAKVLRENGPLDIATVTAYVLQACDAIQEAHASRIIHRDLKPGNLFLTQRRDGAPLIKVLDFGVAKAPEEGDFSLTGTETVVGSPRYMAPEQIRASRAADERSDIWSLGVILYELLSGRPPFLSAALGDLAIKIATEPFAPLRGAPPGFSMIVARCLEKDPVNRFQSIEEFAYSLATCVELAEMPARRTAANRAPAPPMALEANPATADTPVLTTLHGASGAVSSTSAQLGSRRGFVLVGFATTIVIGVGLGVMFGSPSRGSGGGRQPAATSARPVTPVQTTDALPPLPSVATPAQMSPVGTPDPAQAPVSVDAGAPPFTGPAPAGDNHQKPVSPMRRPGKPKSKEQIGESRL